MSKLDEVFSGEQVLKAYCEYVACNWNASLGYGKDKELLERIAKDEEEWLFKLLDVTPEEFADFFEEHRYD